MPSALRLRCRQLGIASPSSTCATPPSCAAFVTAARAAAGRRRGRAWTARPGRGRLSTANCALCARVDPACRAAAARRSRARPGRSPTAKRRLARHDAQRVRELHRRERPRAVRRGSRFATGWASSSSRRSCGAARSRVAMHRCTSRERRVDPRSSSSASRFRSPPRSSSRPISGRRRLDAGAVHGPPMRKPAGGRHARSPARRLPAPPARRDDGIDVDVLRHDERDGLRPLRARGRRSRRPSTETSQPRGTWYERPPARIVTGVFAQVRTAASICERDLPPTSMPSTRTPGFAAPRNSMPRATAAAGSEQDQRKHDKSDTPDRHDQRLRRVAETTVRVPVRVAYRAAQWSSATFRPSTSCREGAATRSPSQRRGACSPGRARRSAPAATRATCTRGCTRSSRLRGRRRCDAS